jgi:tetratricopeptide (TPR) repeat protein
VEPDFAGDVRRLSTPVGPAAFAAFLPEDLTEPSPEQKPRPPRGPDYVWTFPLRATIRLRVVGPDGFLLHDRVKDADWKAGPITVRQRVTADGEARTIVLSLDTGPTRIKGVEYQAAVQGWPAIAEPVGPLSYQSEVESLRNTGRFTEALARARALVEKHPGSAHQRAMLATVLLDAGLIGAARQHAQRATEIDPKLYWAQQILGLTYEYDSLGRRFHEGFDRAALVRQRRRQMELGPDGARSPHELALALSRDAHGEVLSSADDLVEIIRLLTLARKRGWERQATSLLLDALLHAHRYSELETLARAGTTPGDGRYLVAAMAMLRGPDEAVRELSSLPASYGDGDQLLLQAGYLLSSARLYEVAAPLLEEAARRLPDRAADLTDRRFRRRHEELSLDRRKPEDVVRMMKLACLDPAAFLAERGRLVSEHLFEDLLDPANARLNTCGFIAHRTPVMIDTALAVVLSATGTRSGYRVDERLPSQPTVSRSYLVMPDRNGRLQVVATDAFQAARHALSLVDAKRLDEAAQVMDWAVDMQGQWLRANHIVDPDQMPALRRFWPPAANARRDPEVLRLAAAFLGGWRFRKVGVPILERAFARSEGALREEIGKDLVRIYGYQRRDEDALAWLAKLPPELGFTDSLRELRLRALARLDRHPALDDFLAELARRRPGDVGPERTLAATDLERGRLDQAIERLGRIVAAGQASAGDQNDLAWYLFAAGRDRPRAIQLAREAVQLSRRSPAHLHTLACLLVEDGKLDEGIKLANELRGSFPSEPSLALLLGMIADKLGVPDAARAHYQLAATRLKTQTAPDRPSDVSSLAGSRLARLPSTP